MTQEYIVLIFGGDVEVGHDAEGSLVNCRQAGGETYLPLRSAKALARRVGALVAAPVAVVGADDNIVAFVA